MTCFEGMKAYLGQDGRGRLFRCGAGASRKAAGPAGRRQQQHEAAGSPSQHPLHAATLHASAWRRPELNMARLARSAGRLLLGEFDPHVRRRAAAAAVAVNAAAAGADAVA